MVGTFGILATPFLIEESSIFVATLDGTTELIDLNQKFESPIFSTPRIIIIDRHELIIAEVSGVVHCIDFVGIFLRTFKTDGHIFSSFLLHQEKEDCMKILFGCHDKKLRCLKYSFETASIDLEWETETQSQIYGTPELVTIDPEKHVVSCSKKLFHSLERLTRVLHEVTSSL
jgi:hypothetical protein